MTETHSPGLPAGLRAAGVAAGIRAPDLPDLALLVAEEPARAAAVYTRCLLQGAHVKVCRDHLLRSGGRVRALLVNAGNANCSTGEEGLEDNRRVCAALAESLGCPPEQVLFLSTGVIGARLPVERVLQSLPRLVEQASCGEGTGLDAFSRAILTTDTVPKVAARDAGDGRVVGVAKGSGMIHPDMATMFGFLLTDAAPPEDAGDLLRSVCDASFHRLTVDGDTSPNDTVLLLGTGRATVGEEALEEALTGVAVDLSRAIARDGEGATRLVTVRVLGAPDRPAAVRVGRTIATSPLVKTAVSGRDPNWRRILAAAGRAGVPFDPERARVWIGPSVVYEAGRPRPEEEAAAHQHMAEQDEVELGIDLAAGSAEARVWTCDLTDRYVHINADYRT